MSTVTVRIPAPLRAHTGGAGTVVVSGETVAQVLQALAREHDGLIQRLMTPEGALRRFVNLFLDGQRISPDVGLDQPVGDGAELAIIPAVAGGAR